MAQIVGEGERRRGGSVVERHAGVRQGMRRSRGEARDGEFVDLHELSGCKETG